MQPVVCSWNFPKCRISDLSVANSQLARISAFSEFDTMPHARRLILFVHLIVTLMRLARPGGVRSVVAESVLVKHQLLILNRSRKRSRNLRASDRIIAGLCALLMHPGRVIRSAIVLKPSTLLHFHRVLVKRKYRILFSPKRRRKPGPKGPSKELIDAIVEMKRRNPNWGCPRIAQQITLAFGIPINKDVVRRILGNHYQPGSDSGGPSWLTFIGHMKDSLWSVDLFSLSSMRVCSTANILGSCCDGPIHTPDYWLCSSSRRRRWIGVVPDVQSSDPRPDSTEIC
jgi:hypothetical protein